MPAERRTPSDDPAELVARVSAAKRNVLLRVHRHRLGYQDLEDCFGQATLELITRARTRSRAFVSEAHVANALEQRFLSRIADRRRAIEGRSPIEAAMHQALFHDELTPPSDADEDPPLAQMPDPTGSVVEQHAAREDVARLQELADELSDDQRLVLACQVALGMDRAEFCARFGWSAEKFRKVAQRARARLRVLVADYEDGERCRSLADDLAAYVAHVAEGEQSERVRRHLTNCPACAHTARELERVARGVGALLPVPPTLDPEAVHRFSVLGRILGRLLPFWDGGEGATAAKAGAAGAAAAGGGGAVSAGGSLAGLGAAKLGVTALCVAGAAGGYVVCDQIGLFTGPLPRERHHVATATVGHKQRAQHAPSPAVARATAPVTHTIRRSAAAARGHRRSASSPASSSSSSGQASTEFGFEGAGGTKDSAPSSSSTSSGSPRAASAGSTGAGATPSSPNRPAGSGGGASSEFGFE